MQSNKIVSIIVCHYPLADDYGEEKAKGSLPRSDMLRVTMKSIEENTSYPAELIVIDNGGNLDDSNYLLDLTRRGIINTYVRNKENMNFGWAFNQGAALATGSYLCFTCNDIEFNKNWLSITMVPLLKYPEKKLIATPLITPDKNLVKFSMGELDGYRLNSLAGSNCMIMTRDIYEHIGHFTTYAAAGTFWHRAMNKKGYTVVAPATNLATHLAHQGGINFYKNIPVKKTLLTKEVIDYSWKKKS